jgi:hypothetical protein
MICTGSSRGCRGPDGCKVQRSRFKRSRGLEALTIKASSSSYEDLFCGMQGPEVQIQEVPTSRGTDDQGPEALTIKASSSSYEDLFCGTVVMQGLCPKGKSPRRLPPRTVVPFRRRRNYVWSPVPRGGCRHPVNARGCLRMCLSDFAWTRARGRKKRSHDLRLMKNLRIWWLVS